MTAVFTQLTGARPAYDDPPLRFVSNLWRLSGGNAQMNAQMVVAAVFASLAVVANPRFRRSSVLRPAGVVAPLPWRVCVRARGSELDVKAWLPSDTEPSWDDSTHGGSATLPGDQVASGVAGWYSGHIQPGGSELFTDFSYSAS